MAIPQLLVHDQKDNVGVVVVEGLKAGTDMLGVVTETDNSTFKLKAKMDVPIGHKVALKPTSRRATRSSSTARTSATHGRRHRRGRARARPKSQDQALVKEAEHMAAKANGKRREDERQPDASAAGGARTAASACATTSSSCRSTICRTRPARRSPTTSRARWRCRTPMAGCSSAPTSSCIFRTLIGTGANPNVAAVVVIGIEDGWTKRVVDGIAKTGKPVVGFGIEGTATSPPSPRPRTRPRNSCSGPPSCSARSAASTSCGSRPSAARATPRPASPPARPSATCTTS